MPTKLATTVKKIDEMHCQRIDDNSSCIVLRKMITIAEF